MQALASLFLTRRKRAIRGAGGLCIVSSLYYTLLYAQLLFIIRRWRAVPLAVPSVLL